MLDDRYSIPIKLPYHYIYQLFVTTRPAIRRNQPTTIIIFRTAIIDHEVGGTPNYSSTSPPVITSPIPSTSAVAGETNEILLMEMEPAVGSHTDSPPPPLPKGN